jgi:hypothetical protein
VDAAGKEVEFLLEDYRQAWSHYRHLEDARLRYLAFFFTASLGSAAVAVPVLVSARADQTVRILGVAAFLAVFQIFTFFVFITVRRFGEVLVHYSRVMKRNGRLRAALQSIPKKSAGMIRKGRGTPSKFGNAQKAAEVTLTGFLFGSLLLSAATLGFAIEHRDLLPIVVCAVLVAGCATAAVSALVPSPVGKRKKSAPSTP